MEGFFGQYLFSFDVEDNGRTITYQISGDGRDFFAKRNEDENIDKDIYPLWFDYGKINDEIVPTYIKNLKLPNDILTALQTELKSRNIVW